MRIVIDIDGTISPIKREGQSYAEVEPFPGAVDKIKELKQQGHYIILQTARNMATQESNLGKVMKNIGKITLQWLEDYDIPYDEIYFGKPNAHIYIDDRGFRFSDWNQITKQLLSNLHRDK